MGESPRIIGPCQRIVWVIMGVCFIWWYHHLPVASKSIRKNQESTRNSGNYHAEMLTTEPPPRSQQLNRSQLRGMSGSRRSDTFRPGADMLKPSLFDSWDSLSAKHGSAKLNQHRFKTNFMGEFWDRTTFNHPKVLLMIFHADCDVVLANSSYFKVRAVPNWDAVQRNHPRVSYVFNKRTFWAVPSCANRTSVRTTCRCAKKRLSVGVLCHFCSIVCPEHRSVFDPWSNDSWWTSCSQDFSGWHKITPTVPDVYGHLCFENHKDISIGILSTLLCLECGNVQSHGTPKTNSFSDPKQGQVPHCSGENRNKLTEISDCECKLVTGFEQRLSCWQLKSANVVVPQGVTGDQLILPRQFRWCSCPMDSWILRFPVSWKVDKPFRSCTARPVPWCQLSGTGTTSEIFWGLVLDQPSFLAC